MKKTLFTASILTLSLALSGVAQANSNTAPAPIAAQESAAPSAETPTIDADPALWVVKDEDTTIYLFGTVHVLKPGLSWFDEAVKDAFDASDELVLEVIQPSDAEAQKTVFSLAIDPANPLRSRLNEEQLATYDGAMTKLGLPTNAFDQFEPWFASINMGILPLIKAGYDPTSGAESVLTKAAKASGKEISALEGFEEQLGFFDTLPIDSQITLLLGSAEGIDETTPFVDKMVEQWGDGNTEKLAALLNEGFGDPIIYDKLLTQRNANWVEWIDARLDTPGTVFIAVGAGHLAGKDSVQEQLKTKDIAATRIDY
jgi:uncharacterized protein YbaP (TraB family)